MPSETAPTPAWTVLGRAESEADAPMMRDHRVTVVDLGPDGEEIGRTTLAEAALPDLVRDREGGAGSGAPEGAASLSDGRSTPPPRWVVSDTPKWYPALLAAGVRIDRAHDLRLAHAILARSSLVTDRSALTAADEWDAGPVTAPAVGQAETLFDVAGGRGRPKEVPHGIDAALTEFARQQAALETATDPGRLRLLLAAESAGGLVAAEMHAAGVPWDVTEHERILEDLLGPRPAAGAKPSKMLAAAEEVRTALDDSRVSLDSPTRLLTALRNAGINVSSTAKWELAESDHPAIEPLLRYKRMARLLSANGWHWLAEWVAEGRYRPVYVPGGVVTGRWAASGGGALQIPRQLRPALRADPGWRLISADVAQLEPRALAAMSGDRAMAEAGSGRDLYSGLVDEGIVATRQEAKIAVLGAMYGSTTGEAGRLVPRLRQSFPAAMHLVDSAAEAGRTGGVVTTWLGRTSPEPGEGWRRVQSRADQVDATTADENRARRAAGDQGRFTRNFVVQGTAAEWALAWLADLRQRLARLPTVEDSPATASGPAFSRRAHLVFFLHDEVIVHAPEAHADAAADAIREAAASAGRLLFSGAPVDFPLDLTIGERAAAK
ncbi:bifunctional 3'-5' exonuclease/DNA polymerase [Brevibacterium casei]|uniref:bifunctional 3'-5' exonuclease/DNA polymerase n=1 Tax=Brevibacterium casei TaxID=33889 RepID=UPI00186B7F26|nr:bifunctional 3'-5' exonuclease/DNA polymerase [Brevibacterium casei]MBE4693188.1 bifunctional 3'-5' exonuclease/DNA polymerase [Brevibacterium casei]MBY3576311.1 bifunctional 3'-5' exonuclease/DNA polymerase [Brevibacterium casei]